MSVTPELMEASKIFVKSADRANTLYALSDSYAQLLALLDDAEDPASETELNQELDALDGQIREKSEGIAGLVRELEWRARARKDEARRLAERAQSDERKALWLRAYLLANMQAMGIARIESVRFTLTLRDNPPSAELVDLEQVPEEFRRVITKIEADKAAVQRHFRHTGEIVPGMTMVTNQRVEIR